MSAWPDIAALFTAFFAGLLGSGHCFGMCGGIAAGLGTIAAVDNGAATPVTRSRVSSGLLFNTGRVTSYMLLGMLSAWLAAGAGHTLAIPHWARFLRFLTALMIFAIGLRFLFNLHLLGFIEKTGAKAWKAVQPWAARASRQSGARGRFLLGLCWGLLPCGLVYSILATAAATGRPATGAVTMLFFGMGTLPSMLGMSLASPALGALLSDRWTRKLGGLAMVLLAIYSVALMWPR